MEYIGTTSSWCTLGNANVPLQVRVLLSPLLLTVLRPRRRQLNPTSMLVSAHDILPSKISESEDLVKGEQDVTASQEAVPRR